MKKVFAKKINLKKMKKKLSWKRLLITVAIVLVTAVVAAIPLWWEMTQILNVQQDKINSLESQIGDLSEKLNSFYE